MNAGWICGADLFLSGFCLFFSRRWTGSSWWWRRTANCFTYLTTPPSIWAIQWLVNTFSFLIAVNSVAFIFPPKLRRSENPSFQHRMMAPLKMTNFGTQFQNYFDRNAWKNRQFDTRLNRFHFFRFENFTHGQIDQFWNPFPPISPISTNIDWNAWKNRQFDTRLNRFHFFRFAHFTLCQIDQFWNRIPPILTVNLRLDAIVSVPANSSILRPIFVGKMVTLIPKYSTHIDRWQRWWQSIESRGKRCQWLTIHRLTLTASS